MPKTLEVPLRDSMKVWISMNPLRLWRHEHQITRRVAAHLLGVHPGTVQNWEDGMGQPQEHHFARLNQVSLTIENWPARWEAWRQQQPQITPREQSA